MLSKGEERGIFNREIREQVSVKLGRTWTLLLRGFFISYQVFGTIRIRVGAVVPDKIIHDFSIMNERILRERRRVL